MTRADIFQVVKANITRIVEDVDAAAISERVSMSELGADSLQVVEVVSRSMKELKLKVPRTELSTAQTLKDLLDLFQTAAAGGA